MFTYAHISLAYKSTLHVGTYTSSMDGMGKMIKDSRSCVVVRNRGDGCYKIPNVPASIWQLSTAGVGYRDSLEVKERPIKTVVILELLSRNAY